MKMKIPAAAAVCVALVAMASSALADPPATTTRAAAKGGDGKGYRYDFPDDGLLGIDGMGTTPMIKVRPPPRRDVLLRPRLQFVSEMLKSVENM